MPKKTLRKAYVLLNNGYHGVDGICVIIARFPEIVADLCGGSLEKEPCWIHHISVKKLVLPKNFTPKKCLEFLKYTTIFEEDPDTEERFLYVWELPLTRSPKYGAS